jgi:hypothetical protein
MPSATLPAKTHASAARASWVASSDLVETAFDGFADYRRVHEHRPDLTGRSSAPNEGEVERICEQFYGSFERCSITKCSRAPTERAERTIEHQLNVAFGNSNAESDFARHRSLKQSRRCAKVAVSHHHQQHQLFQHSPFPQERAVRFQGPSRKYST